jgi:glucans biosynthesis protein
MEIPTTNELADNTVTMWEPSKAPNPGEKVEFAYRQIWTSRPDPSEAGGYVVATRSGLHDWQPEQRTLIVEFAGEKLFEKSETPLSAQVEAMGEAGKNIKIQGINIQPIGDNRIRASFQITPAQAGMKLNQLAPVELRCCLKRGEDFLTETWSSRVIP